MKRLILMRHAKSSWADPNQSDHDRPLNERGRRDAPRVGDWLAARGLTPDAALVSTAARAQETWARLGSAFAEIPMTPRRDLYHASPAEILRALRAAPDATSLLVLGHQPGIGAVAAQLLAAPPQDTAFVKYPTAAMAAIDFDAAAGTALDWERGALAEFVTPAVLD